MEQVMKRLAFAVALLCVLEAPGLAQEQQSFKTVIGKGFDIKAVTFARGDATDNKETFIVTLQKEKSVAVCYFSANAWLTLANTILEDPKRCDVR
jgi:hypothetical protein